MTAPQSRAEPSPTVEVSIELPAGWWELPVTSTAIRRDVAAVVDARLMRTPDAPVPRDGIVRLLEEVTTQAQRAGAVFAAQIGIRDAGDEGVESFSASMILALRALPGMSPGHELDQLEALVGRLAVPGGDAESDVVTERVALGHLGKGVRHRAVRHLTGDLRVATVSYYFPVEGMDHIAIVNASSPNASAGRDVVELFDEIVSTIRVTPVGRTEASEQ